MTVTPEVFSLNDKVALVTGAGMGIGRAVTTGFAAFGAHVAICDRDGKALQETKAEIERAGRRCLTGEFDVRDADEVRAFVDETAESFGRLDVVVNNAGGGFRSGFGDLSDRAQDALMRENFSSVAHVCRAALPLLGDGGAVVNITSIEAHRAGPEYAVYSAMKAAVANLTKSLALEVGGRSIRVNCIAPDVIPTPGLGGEEGLGAVKTPLPKRGHADDVAAAAVYLASDASSFVTGTTIHVDGGNLAAGGWRRSPDGGFHT